MSSKEFAIKQYNWHGKVVGYQQSGSWIPANVDSYMSREIENRIKCGDCELREPEISSVYDIRDDAKNLRGYLWNGLFVPVDEKNELYQLINKHIISGDCKIFPEPKNQLWGGKKITEFIVGIYFDSQWLSIKNEILATIDYDFGTPNAISYNVRFKNLYCPHSPAVEEIIMQERKIPYSQMASFCGDTPRGATLEITLPTNRLAKIFNLYRQKMRTANVDISHLQDQLDMHLAQTGRSKDRGPTIEWLIIHLWEYIDDFVLDVGNRALDFISYQGYAFEDQNIKHISRHAMMYRNYILRKYTDSTYELHKGSFFQDYRFYSADEGKSRLNEQSYENIVNEISLPKAFEAKYRELPLKKVRTLIECGLTLEALCVLNGYLEVTFKMALQRVFSPNQMGIKDKISSLSHRNVLKIVQIINHQVENPHCFSNVEIYRINATKIYRHRNDYIHAMELPERSVFMTNATRMALEALMHPFIQATDSHHFLIYLDSYRTIHHIQELILVELDKFIKR